MKINPILLMFFCALIQAQDEFEIPQSLLDEVENGNHEVAYFIANSYHEGTGGVGEPNEELAREWLLKAAEMGSAHAMHEWAGLLHLDGKRMEALGWFQSAADLGFGKSHEAIAGYHYMGYAGLNKDCQKAYEWYEKAQAKGVELSFNNHAWYLSTSADENCRNPEKAVVVFSQLKSQFDGVEKMPWSYRDTEAAVLAGIADYSSAIKLQQQLVEDVLSFDEDASEFQRHLDQFLQRKPWIGDD